MHQDFISMDTIGKMLLKFSRKQQRFLLSLSCHENNANLELVLNDENEQTTPKMLHCFCQEIGRTGLIRIMDRGVVEPYLYCARKYSSHNIQVHLVCIALYE